MLRSFLSITAMTMVLTLWGQDLESFLEDQLEERIVETTATFKSTRIVNGHSIERNPEGQLEFRVSHRFGRVNSGAYEFFGLDQAHIHLSLEYGIKDWVTAGLGRGTFEKTVDGYVKFSPLRQSSGRRAIPVSVSYFSGIYVNGIRWPDPSAENLFSDRLSFVQQLLVARKFNHLFSLQLTPTYYHRNLPEPVLDPTDLWAVGIGSRLKITNRIALNAEYYLIYKPDDQFYTTEIYNPLSVGLDIETGGHVFQIVLTNSTAMREQGFIAHTTGRWLDGDIHLGFNISRVFQIN